MAISKLGSTMQRFTHDGISFELSPEIELRLTRLASVQIEYASGDPESKMVPIDELASPKPNPGITRFNLERMSRILDGLESGSSFQ